MAKKFVKEISKMNKLYEVEFDGTLYYQIAHIENGTAGTFEHDYALVKRIEEYIKLHGRALSKTKERLVFPTAKDGTPALALSAFLYHCYHGVPIEQVRSAKVQHVGLKYLPDGSEDCRKQSLVHMSGVQYKTYNREFRPVTIGGGEFVELRMRAHTNPVYIDNDPVLIDLLADTSLFNNFHFNGRTGIQAQLRAWNGESRDMPYIHQIACAVKMGLLSRENFSDLGSIIEQIKGGGGEQIDHMYADVFNNTYQNLSIMSRTVNGLKEGYTAANFGQYHIAWAHDWDSGVYLVEITTEFSDKGEVQQHYRCSGEWELLSCIENLMGRDRLTKKMTHIIAVDTDGQLVSMPLPGRAFAEEKERYKANGGARKYPRVENDTVNSVENGARLLALYKNYPEKFAPWPNTRGGISMSNPTEGVNALLHMLGWQIATD